ncbi:MAG: ABC transporter ATP-binding protein [Bacteroidota bacterium]|jgi:ATP-binding cassette subfamily B multidrug efflux pump
MQSLKAVNKYLLKYKSRLLLGFLFVCLNSVLLTFPGIYIGRATELFRNLSENKNEFLIQGLMIIVFSISGGFFMFLMRQTIIVMSRLIEFDQKNEIYSHYQQLDQNFYKKNYTGDLMNRISEDVSRVRMYTGPAIMYLANTFATIITSIIFMVNVDYRMALVVIAPLPVLSFIIYKVSARINKNSTLMQEKLSDITTLSQETFSGIRLIKSFAREKHFTDKMNQQNAEYKKRNLSLALTEAFFHPFMIFMVGLSLILAVYTGGLLVIKNEVKAGDISSYVFYIFRLTWPFASLGWVTSLIQRASASQKRINEFLQTQPEIKNINSNSTPIQGRIEFLEVTYTYSETEKVALKNVSFSVEEGKSLGIIGKTGSGKSTIANLICRIYDVNTGNIFIDNKNIKELNLNDLRGQIGYVPQDVFLFSDTISNNISFGLKDVNDKLILENKITEAARQAAVYDNIMEFPEGLNTVIGERGFTLSGGQKQRISIARAIIKEPKILIFDDCLSAVDTETEDEILASLKKVMKNKTSLFISHRISGIKNADHIIFLNEGKITEQGTHDELMDLKGDYAELYRLQTLEKTIQD